MPKVNFGTKPTRARSKRSSAGGCVNFIREVDGDSIVLYRRPGFSSQGTVGSGVGRGAIVAAGTAYIVNANEFYSMDASYNETFIGNLQTRSGNVSMSFDGTFIVIVDGQDLYTYNTEHAVFTRHNDPDIFTNPTHVTFSDGFHFINDPETGQIMTHASSYRPDGDWDALDFATAEFNPDQLKAIIATHSNVLLIGETTTEPWEYDPNSSALPLRPIRAGYMEYGTAAPYSPIKFDNGVAWLARDANGQGVMIRSNGMNVQRLSDSYVEAEWANYSDVSDAFCQVWWLEGHPLLMVTFPTADKTWVYDSSLPDGLHWSEWQRGDDNPNLRGRMRFAWSINLNGKTVCGDYESGDVYEIDWDVKTDNGTQMHWSCRTDELKTQDEEWVAHRQLTVYMEGGVGKTDSDDQGFDPIVWMRYSDDHGENWVEREARSYGKKGEYNKRVFWHQLGASRHRIYELYGTEPVTTVVAGGSFL